MRVMQQKHMFWWLFCCVFVVLFNYTTNIAKNIVSYVLVCLFLFVWFSNVVNWRAFFYMCTVLFLLKTLVWRNVAYLGNHKNSMNL